MTKLNAALIHASRSPWRFALVAALNAGAFAVLFALEDRFKAITGLPVFDTQNGLTPEALVQQLFLYQGEALTAYLAFAAFDFVFPFVAALFLAATWALLLRAIPWRFAQRLLAWGLPLYAFLGTGFDYLENLSLLSILAMDAPSGMVVEAAIFFKRLKLAALGLSGTLTAVFVMLAALAFVRRARWLGGGETPIEGAEVKQLRDFVIALGSRLNPGLLAVLVVALNVYWLVILAVINREFQAVTNGHPLLDLQNSLAPGEIITPAKVLEQLGDYTQASKFIYWIFFILDNIMPHLAFGSIALLWVYFWRIHPNRLYRWLLGGYAVLIPLGVGVFDWLENLFYLVAIHTYPAPNTVWAVYAGLTFKWLKAACVFPSTLLTPIFLAYHLFCALQRRTRRSLMGS